MTAAGVLDANAKVLAFLGSRYPWLRPPRVIENPYDRDETRYFLTDCSPGPHGHVPDGYYDLPIPRWWDEHARHLLIHELGHLLEKVAGKTRDVIREWLVAMGGDPSLNDHRMRAEMFAEHFARAEDPMYYGQDYPALVWLVPFDAAKMRAFCESLRAESLVIVPDPTGFLLSHPITSPFGPRPQFGDFHTGIDLALNAGTPIPAVRGGTVVLDDDSADGAPGISVKIQCDDGELWWYAHLESNSVVARQIVAAGQVIGKCGATGAATGPHLHLERQFPVGLAIDPEEELRMLSQQAQDQIRDIVREEVGRGARVVGETITSGFNLTLVHRLRRLGRFLRGGAYDVAGVGGTDTQGYPDDNSPLA